MIQISTAARIATAAPMITCTVIAVVPWKPNTQGEKNRHAPRIRFATSHNFALLQLSMAPSIEGFVHDSTKEPLSEFRLGLTIFNETHGDSSSFPSPWSAGAGSVR